MPDSMSAGAAELKLLNPKRQPMCSLSTTLIHDTKIKTIGLYYIYVPVFAVSLRTTDVGNGLRCFRSSLKVYELAMSHS